jgi:hypothetical protein
MKRQIIILATVLATVAGGVSAQNLRLPPCDYWCQMLGQGRPVPPRVMPSGDVFKVPRSVGAMTVVPDMSTGPFPWWSLTTGRPLWQSFEFMRDKGLTAVGAMLRANPTDVIDAVDDCGNPLPNATTNNENIRRAFRMPGIDIIVIEPLWWASTEQGCTGLKNIRWQHIPPHIFEDLYRVYSGQNKVIIVQDFEVDWTVHGLGCRERDECVTSDPGCVDRCEAGGTASFFQEWWPEGYVRPTGCQSMCCDLVKLNRAWGLLRHMNAMETAAMAARAAHPDKPLRVFYSVEVNFFADEFLLIARDVIPRMDAPPDFVALGLYKKAGDVIDAFNNVVDWTGLPPHRIFLSEVGAREGTQPDGSFIEGTPQYDRIVPVVEELFARGIAFALVWSFEEVAYTGGHTGFAVIDAVTGEERSGMAAIRELNGVYR